MLSGMFSKNDLKQALDAAVATETHPIAMRRFGPEDFEVPDSEQYLVICRSPRSALTDSLQFWVACLHLLRDEGYVEDDALRSYALAGRHRPLNEPDWGSFVRYCTASLRKDPGLGIQGRFVAAMMMTDEWTDRSALSETDGEHLAVFWGTTA